MSKQHKIVKCPTCGKSVDWSPEQRWRPFCSERCRLMDLGAWVEEEHRIPSEEQPMPPHPPDSSEEN